MIPQHDFYQALRIVLSMVADSHPKLPELASLLIECALEGELRLVGSDGERIVVVKLRCEHGQPVKTAIRVSRQEAAEVMRLFTADTPLSICFTDNMLMVTDGIQVGILTALPGAYPDYRAVMHHKPGDKGPRAFRRRDLAEALAILEPLTDTVELDINGLLGPGYIEWKGDGVIKSVVMGFSPVTMPVVDKQAGK